MKQRKRQRAEPFESVRHTKRREALPAFVAAHRANPLNRMTNRQVTTFQRMESALLAKKRKDGAKNPKITPAENERLLEAARLA